MLYGGIILAAVAPQQGRTAKNPVGVFLRCRVARGSKTQPMDELRKAKAFIEEAGWQVGSLVAF